MSELNYSYRFLEADDFDQFISLHKSKKRFMNNTMSETEQDDYLKRLTWLFEQPDYKVAGCFENGILVASEGGRFFKKFGVWYNHGQCFNLGDRSLSQGQLFLEVNYQLGTRLMRYGESMGIYQVYQARELRQGLAEFEYFNRLVKRGKLPFDFRYIPLMDKVYMPGDLDILEQHKFFFRPSNEVKIPTLVSLVVLKQEYRQEYILK